MAFKTLKTTREAISLATLGKCIAELSSCRGRCRCAPQ
jgi:hypothetical protein